MLFKTPQTFDVSVWELFGTLAVGARMVIATPDGHRDPAYLAEVVAAEGVTITSFVPSMPSVFAGSVEPAQFPRRCARCSSPARPSPPTWSPRSAGQPGRAAQPVRPDRFHRPTRRSPRTCRARCRSAAPC